MLGNFPNTLYARSKEDVARILKAIFEDEARTALAPDVVAEVKAGETPLADAYKTAQRVE